MTQYRQNARSRAERGKEIRNYVGPATPPRPLIKEIETAETDNLKGLQSIVRRQTGLSGNMVLTR